LLDLDEEGKKSKEKSKIVMLHFINLLEIKVPRSVFLKLEFKKITKKYQNEFQFKQCLVCFDELNIG